MRVAGLDTRIQQAKNLFPNPGFEKHSSGSTSTRWRNLCPNPTARVSTAGWSGNAGNGAASVSREVVGGPDNLNWVKMLFSQSLTGAANGTYLGVNAIASNNYTNILPSRYYSVSMWVFSSIANVFSINAVERKSNGTIDYGTVVADLYGSNVAVPANTWTRLTFSAVARSDTIALEARIRPATTGSLYSAGDFYGSTKVMVSQTPYLLDYFDGETLNNLLTSPFGLDYSYAWAGTLGLSQTIVTGPTPNTEIFRNLMTNPCARGDLASWSVTGGAGGGAATIERITDSTGPLYQPYVRATWTASGTGGNGGIDFGANIPAVAGEPIAITLRVRANQAISSVVAVIDWYTSGTVYISGTTSSKAIAANTWTEFTVVGTAPANTAKIIPHLRPTSAAVVAGLVLEATMVCITKTPSVVEFFDGNFSLGKWNDPDFSLGWTGTANASASIVSGVSIKSAGSSSAGGAIQSFVKVGSGNKSLRLITKAVSRDSYVDLQLVGGTFAAMMDGKTYTAMAKSYQSGAISNPTGGNRPRSMWAVTTGAAVGGNLGNSVAGANTAGFTDHRFVFTVNTGATYKAIRVINGGDVNQGDIWWDDLTIVEGVYTGPPINGDKVYSRWLDQSNDSSSVGYPNSV